MASPSRSVEQIFIAALELPREERSAFLDQACEKESGVRRQVENLLAEDEQAGSFLENPLVSRSDSSQARGDSQLSDSQLSDIDTHYEQPRFSAGEVIADRFLVTRFIARGGMGEVYEVEDRLLQGTHVALKVIRSAIAGDASSRHRFEQEVILARRINHPNLCPIYDIFHCPHATGPFLFLTMKLLQGETLAVRLQRSLRIPRDEASAVGTDLIAAVRAMHSAGIIHRDIKPNNVMLEHFAGRTRASVMDFGLARLHEAEATFITAGAIAGTPGYLAPELLQGQLPTRATDIFSLGVVLHQVLAGDRPELQANGRSVMPSPSFKSADGSPQLLQAVRDFIADDPAQRCRAFDTMRPLAEAQVERSPDSQWSRRRFIYAGAASLTAVAGGTVLGRNVIYQVAHPIPHKRFVALLDWPPVKDLSVKPMIQGLIDAMETELTRAEAFDKNFYVAQQEKNSTATVPRNLSEVGASMGANLVLATTGSMQADRLHVVLSVLDPDSARPLRTREIKSSTTDQFALPGRVVRAAAQLLNVAQFEPSYRHSQAGTDVPAALRAYQAAESLMKLPNDEGVEQAIESYKAAVEADPRYVLAYAQLCMAYLRLYQKGLDPSLMVLARANATTAVSLDPKSVEGHRAMGIVYFDTGAYLDALKELEIALSLDPADSKTLTYQAQAYTALNRWKDAETTYNRALKLRPNWWLPYNELGNNYNGQGDSGNALTAFRAASTLAPKNADVFNNIASMYFQLGRYPEALAAINQSIALAPRDFAYQTRADILRAQGRVSDALQSALEGARIDPGDGLNWLQAGDAYSLLPGHHKDAIKAYLTAVEAKEKQLQTESKSGPDWMLLALFRIKSGNNSSGLALVRKAESLGAADIYSQLYKVRIFELLGHREEALQLLRGLMQKGVTVYQVKAVRDLDALRNDPHFQA